MVITEGSAVEVLANWAEIKIVLTQRRKIKKNEFLKNQLLETIKTSFCRVFDADSEYIVFMFIYLCFHHVRDTQSLSVKTFFKIDLIELETSSDQMGGK